jgi:hypothetical protein
VVALKAAGGALRPHLKSEAWHRASAQQRAQHSSLDATPARAGNRHFGRLSALCAHAKSPSKMDLHMKKIAPRRRPSAARAVERVDVAAALPGVGRPPGATTQ